MHYGYGLHNGFTAHTLSGFIEYSGYGAAGWYSDLPLSLHKSTSQIKILLQE